VRKKLCLITAAILVVLVLNVHGQQKTVNACETSEAKEFDFHIGTWKSRDGKETHLVEKFLDGCAIRETWTREDGQFAAGVKSYDKTRALWLYSWVGKDFYHQLWVGRRENGEWRFYREWTSEGQAVLSRTWWSRLADGSIDRVVEQSRDQGKTWKPHVRVNFVRKK
jgi:hypothetical protein